MITQAEAFALAANWPVYVAIDQTDVFMIVLNCGKCSRSCGQLRRGVITYNGTLDEMLSMVLRHMVMAHDVPLAGLRKDADSGT